MDLPDWIPLFPLPNAVLFPGVPLPLRIFEPRYCEMVGDAEGGANPMIGMVLLRGDWQDDYHGRPQIFARGCAGKMLRCERLPDGRYNILLQGLREFTVEEEDESKSYRRGRVLWCPPPADCLSEESRERVRSLMRRLEGLRESRVATRLLEDNSISDELLVNFLCYALDFSPLEKQALLEAPAVSGRTARLCDVIQFALNSGTAPSDDDWRH